MSHKKLPKAIFVIFLILVLSAIAASLAFKRPEIKTNKFSTGPGVFARMYLSSADITNVPQAVVSSNDPSFVSNSSNTIEVPFTSQAPYGVWDKVHNEACEEANVVMAYAWIKGIALTPEFAEGEIQRLTRWGLGKFNSYDTTAGQTALMAKEVYGINSKIIQAPSVEEIKVELNKGNIIVAGMAGKLLENHHYRSPGPLYHMLLIKGYDDTGFITNDPGTKYGQGFHFSYNNIMQAAHDWSGLAETLLASPAVIIIFSKNQ
jgi:hypothetical protein